MAELLRTGLTAELGLFFYMFFFLDYVLIFKKVKLKKKFQGRCIEPLYNFYL